jgi:serine/threonine protein kinase
MSISTAPERGFGLVGAIVKNRYRLNAISSVTPDVVVYSAEELRYGRPIALKVLRDDAAGDAEFVAAVREQASTLALSPYVHRGLPRVYECGTTDTGELFIALEPTKGVTLREVLDARGALDPPTALRITSQVGEALETLHHSRIVHGELGPESVLLVRDDDGAERVTLVGVELTAAYRTTHGQRRRNASPSTYLAPEQLEGGEITDATDQYALGMLLRELLTADGSPEPLDVDAATPALPPDIARIITTALDARPERRFPDISVMVNDMWAAQTALPDPPPRPRAVEARRNTHRRPRVRRPQVTLRIAAAVATAGIIAAVVWFALSGALVSRFRALLTGPPVTALPGVQDATPSVVLPIVPVSVPAAPSAAREETPIHRESPTLRNASTAEGLAHPSAAPRPEPIVERPAIGASPRLDRSPARPVEPGTAAERPAINDQAATNGGDGSAIIEWVLNRRR